MTYLNGVKKSNVVYENLGHIRTGKSKITPPPFPPYSSLYQYQGPTPNIRVWINLDAQFSS
jgi:hypothetical protein